jgi:DNA-binding protein YbaB
MAYGAEDMLRSFEMRARQQAEQAQQLSQSMQSRTATMESPGGEVRVTVDSTGGLAGLQFGAGADRIALDRLAELVLQVSRQAQAELAAAMSQLVVDMYGAGSATARFVSEAYTERFPSPVDDEDGERR